MAQTTNRKKVDRNINAQAGELREIPLSDIDWKSYENQRSGNFMMGDTPDSDALDHSDFKSLVGSIRDVGLKDPITVRPHPQGKGAKGEKFELIKGFRRYAAIRVISDEDHIKAPRIKAFIKELDDLEAFDEHVTENTARDNLKGPDLAFAAFKMRQLRRSNGEDPSAAEIARRMGKNQGYINELLNIVEKAPKVADRWRNEPIQLSVNEMKSIAKLKTPDEQTAQYEKVLKRSTPGSDPDEWVQLAADKAARGTAFLGRLQKDGLIAVAEDIDWGDHLKSLGVTIKEGAKASQLKVITEAAANAFANALNPPKDETPKRKGGRKAAKETGEAPETAPN